MNEGRELTAASFAPFSHEPMPLTASPTNPSSSLSSLERTAIAACIAKHGGNLSLVAKELGISRGALYRKIEKHGL